jgi:hypothetical protein
MIEAQHNPAQNLWQRQPVEGMKMSAEALHLRAGKFERRIMWRNGREYAGSVVAAAGFTFFFLKTHGILFRIAYALFIAGLAWIVIQLHRKGSAKNVPSAFGSSTCLDFFRGELERQRDVVKNVWPWYLAPLVPGFVVLTAGYVLARPFPFGLGSAVLLDLVVAGLFLLIWKMNQRAARCLQRTIDELYASEKQP